MESSDVTLNCEARFVPFYWAVIMTIAILHFNPPNFRARRRNLLNTCRGHTNYFVTLDTLLYFKMYTANEGPVRIQYKCMLPIFMHSQKWNCYFQNRIIIFYLPVPRLIYLWDIYVFPGSVCLFCWRKICGLSLGINKSLTDTWMWKWGLRPRNSQKRGTLRGFSLQCSFANRDYLVSLFSIQLHTTKGWKSILLPSVAI